MHIPQAMLQGTVCPVTAALGIGVIATAVIAAIRSKNYHYCTPMNFALVSALVFAGQMLNFPIASGTSGHLLGGVIAVTLLGLPYGVLSLALTVTLQCLFFADGGLDMLGANILNMAGLGAGIGGMIMLLLQRHCNRYVAIFAASWGSVVIASLAVTLELAAAGTVPLTRVLPAMLGVHMLIGIGEGIIAIVAIAFLSLPEGGTQPNRIPIVASLITAVLLAPFACGFPDGLEWVAEKLQFLKESAPSFVAPMPEYTIPTMHTGLLSQWIAATTGIALTLIMAYIAALALHCKQSANIETAIANKR